MNTNPFETKNIYPTVEVPINDLTLKLPNDFKHLVRLYTFKNGYQHCYCQFHADDTVIYLPSHDIVTKKKIHYPDVLSVEYVPYSEEEKQEITRKINNAKSKS